MDRKQESTSSFEQTVIEQLTKLEDLINNELRATRELLQEIVRRDLKHVVTNNVSMTENTFSQQPQQQQRPLFFVITDILHPETNEILSFYVSGRTFDVRDQIKAFGNCTWNKDQKAWEFVYNPKTRENVEQFLLSLTTDVQINNIVQ